jgi:shikimate dehydrogenase
VYLAGAGGAAKAIADALAEAGVRALGIHNRTAARAAELVQHLQSAHPALDVHVASAEPQAYALAVNATSLGLHAGDPLPFKLDRLAAAAVVAEVVMAVEMTPLLTAAKTRGHPVHPGRHMLDGQLDQIARFLGVLPAP